VNSAELIPLPPTGKVGQKITPVTAALRKLAQGPVGHSLHFTASALGQIDDRKAQMKLASYASHAAGSGWYATRRCAAGNRIWKIAEPSDPPVHFFADPSEDGGSAPRLAK
jgi:hypothetical protein